MTRPVAIVVYSSIGLGSAILGFIFGAYVGWLMVLLSVG